MRSLYVKKKYLINKSMQTLIESYLQRIRYSRTKQGYIMNFIERK